MLKLRFEVEWILVSFAAWLVPKLPRSVVTALADLIAWILYRVDPRSRVIALQNLKAVFGERYTEAERVAIAKASLRTFARTFLELFWSPRLSPQNYREFFEFEDLRPPELVGKPTIYICIHGGNFEWMSHAFGFESGTQGVIIAQEFKNPKLDPIFNRLRQSADQTIVTKKSAMLRLFKELKKGRNVAMLIDLTLKREDPHVLIRAFGLKMRVTFIHAFFHQRTGVPIVPISNLPIGGGRYRCTMHPPLELEPNLSEAEITQRCWDFFEGWITKHPELWLWSYKYFRERDPENPDAYPPYARGGVKKAAKQSVEEPL